MLFSSFSIVLHNLAVFKWKLVKPRSLTTAVAASWNRNVSMNWKSEQYRPGVATEVESTWIHQLYEKFKEVDEMKTNIQSILLSLDRACLPQKNKLNESFDEIIACLEKRRAELLTGMAEQVSDYKKELNRKLLALSSDRQALRRIKLNYEENINNKELRDIEQRESRNVQIISDALHRYEMAAMTAKRIKPKSPEYVVNKEFALWIIANLGDFSLSLPKAEAPTISILQRTQSDVLAEIMMDHNSQQEPVCLRRTHTLSELI